MYTIEEFDKAKTQVLKYVMYKKRTQQEVKNKFIATIEENLLEDVLQELQEIGYISDNQYIERAVNEFRALKNLSRKEIKYKLMAKGIKPNDWDNYYEKHKEELQEYEKKSAENIVLKKMSNMEEIEIKQYLLKKGYEPEYIQEAMEKIEE